MNTVSTLPRGTYQFDTFQNPKNELHRLKQQASVLPNLELQNLLNHGLLRDMQVLDAACGPGIISCMIAKYLTDGHLTGIDADGALLKEARQLARKQEVFARFENENVYFLPYKEKFDYIYCRFLFQHLEEPERAMKTLYRALKPGGTLHILDVDDDWLSMYPEVPEFKNLSKLAAKYQAAKGGNRYVGKSLRHLFKQQSFEQIQTQVVSISSDMIGLETFLRLTTSFKLEIIGKENQAVAHRQLQRIQEKARQEDLLGMVGLFSVSAQKPLQTD